MIRGLIPHFIHQQYQHHCLNGQLDVVAMFVDVSGFTKLTETLMEQDQKDGAETLTTVINDIFTPLIEEVRARGGLISHFAGDAFTALFPETLAQASLQAVQTAFFVKEFLANHGNIETKYGNFTLAVKIGLSRGKVTWHIFGRNQRLTYCFQGEAIDGCAEMEHYAEAGEIIADSRLQPDLQNQVEMTGLPNGTSVYKLMTCAINLPRLSQSHRPFERADLVPFILDGVIDLTAQAEFREVCNIFISFQPPKNSTLLNKFVTLVIDLITDYGGYFNRLSFGDKGAMILALFGAPTAHENGLERAANFLLALANFSDDNTASPLPVMWRAGLTIGPAYAGFVGSDQRCEYTAMGDTTNLAARLMTTAPWGEIWVSEAVYNRLQNRYKFEARGEHRFKGKLHALPVYQLVGQNLLEEMTFYTGDMIGRQAELIKLNQLIQPIFEGQFAGVAYIYGEAGIGKSRLIYELHRQLHGVTWLHCPAEEILRQPLNPFKHFLKNYFKQHPEVSSVHNKNRFKQILNELLSRLPPEAADIHQELERTWSLLGALVNLYWPDSLYEQLDPRLRFDNTLTAIKNLVKAESLFQPVLIELEDAHWLDQDSLEMIKVLSRNIPNFPIAILYVGRYTDDGSKTKLPLDAAIPSQEIDLNYLSPADLKQLAERILAGAVSNKVIDQLLEKTNGNPFFAEQMILDLQERNLFSLVDEQYELATSHLADIPANINAVLVSRLDRLINTVKQTVQTAAVLGRDFEVQILMNMLQTDSHLLSQRIRQAEQERIWSALTETRYIFKHALLRDAAYNMQLRARLRELHQLAGEALETTHANDLAGYYADLAYHYEQANIVDKTILYLEKAGDQAKDNYQNETALNFYNRLLAYSLNKHTETAIYSKQGEILSLTGPWDLAVSMLNKGIAGAKESNDLSRVAQLQINLGDVLRKKGDNELALKTLEEARLTASRIGDKTLLGRAVGIIAASHKYNTEYERSLVLYQQALQLGEEVHDLLGMAVALVGLGSACDLTGQYARALEFDRRVIPMLEEMGDKKWLVYAMMNTGAAYRAVGDYESALTYLQQTKALAEELGAREIVWITVQFIGYTHHSAGEDEAALPYFQEALRLYDALGGTGIPFQTNPYLAMSYVSLGHYREALQTALAHLHHIEKTGKDVEYGMAHFVIGWTLAKLRVAGEELSPALDRWMPAITAKTGYSTEPEPYFQHAIEAAQVVSGLYTLMPTLYRYGEYLCRTGREVEGRQYLATAKQKALHHGMQGELAWIRQVCQTLPLDFETL